MIVTLKFLPMRNLTLILISLSFMNAMAQKEPVIAIPFDTVSEKYAYVGVVKAEERSSSFLYKNAKTWLIGLNGNDSMIDIVNDSLIRDRGTVTVTLVIKGAMGVKIPIPYNVSYMITLEFKEGRYRYTITNFTINGSNTGSDQSMALETYVKQHENMNLGKRDVIAQEEQFCAELDDKVKKLIESMKASIGVDEKADDW